MLLLRHRGVIIDDDVLFVDYIMIIANEHNYQDINIPIWKQGCHSNHIMIGNGTWVGINVVILAGTIIGSNCVVGAGSVLKGTYPDFTVIAGNPARVIKRYNKEKDLWERI